MYTEQPSGQNPSVLLLDQLMSQLQGQPAVDHQIVSNLAQQLFAEMRHLDRDPYGSGLLNQGQPPGLTVNAIQFTQDAGMVSSFPSFSQAPDQQVNPPNHLDISTMPNIQAPPARSSHFHRESTFGIGAPPAPSSHFHRESTFGTGAPSAPPSHFHPRSTLGIGAPPAPSSYFHPELTLGIGAPSATPSYFDPASTLGIGAPSATLATESSARPIARRRRQRPTSSHPYQPGGAPQPSSGQAASSASAQNPPTFFWLNESQGWKFPERNMGAQSLTPRDILAQCVDCPDLVLSTPEDLACHRVLKHKAGYLLRCGYNSCRFEFEHSVSRTHHLKTHHSIQIEQHCPFCQSEILILPSQSFSASLRRHLFVEHLKIENWSCGECGNYQATLESLYYHYNQQHPHISRKEIRQFFINPGTGLPANPHYINLDEVTTIVAFANGKLPQIANPVDWSRPNPTS